MSNTVHKCEACGRAFTHQPTVRWDNQPGRPMAAPILFCSDTCSGPVSLPEKPDPERERGTMNRAAFERLIAEDVEWLDSLPHSLERSHVREIVRNCAKHYYGRPSSETPVRLEGLEKLAETWRTRMSTDYARRNLSRYGQQLVLTCADELLAELDRLRAALRGSEK